jgi:hypothetical protein
MAAGPFDLPAPFVHLDAGAAAMEPQNLVKALVDVRPDLPLVEPAARLDLLDVERLLLRRRRLAVERKAGIAAPADARRGGLAISRGLVIPTNLNEKCNFWSRFLMGGRLWRR